MLRRTRLLALVFQCVEPWYLGLEANSAADGHYGQCNSHEVKGLLAVHCGKFHRIRS